MFATLVAKCPRVDAAASPAARPLKSPPTRVRWRSLGSWVVGRALRDARDGRRATQASVGETAALSPSTVSEAENGHGDDMTLRTWTRLARAAGSDLHAYLERASAADLRRDSVHLRHQELLIRTAIRGGWKAIAEAAIDDPARGSRSVDILLERKGEVAVIEVFDWFDDVGAALRAWQRKVARVEERAAGMARPAPGSLSADAPSVRVSGCWTLRATTRNRRLVAAHAEVFRSRFPYSGRGWLRCLEDPAMPMPRDAGILWISVRGDRLWPARG